LLPKANWAGLIFHSQSPPHASAMHRLVKFQEMSLSKG